MAEVYLFCEGKSDVSVLDPVFQRVLGAGIVIEAVGGPHVGPAAEFWRQRSRDHAVTVAYVRDRDYLRKAEADASFTDGRPGFVWRRHSIESYLIQPAIVAEALTKLKRSFPAGHTQSWVDALPDDPAIIAAALRTLAERRAPREACRMTIARLWEDLSETAGRVQKRDLDLPVDPPPDSAGCRQAIVNEAARLAAKAHEAASSPHLTAAAVSARYDRDFARITAADYLDSSIFIEEFHGKELCGDLRTWLSANHGARLSRDLFERELAGAVVEVYRTTPTLYGSDDFRDLANGVRALAGLPPLQAD